MVFNNIVISKSKSFALRGIKLYKFLSLEKKEYILSVQILKSSTSIGANIREATRAQSVPDFYSKLNIALKEAEETAYWLELLAESSYITQKQFNSLYDDCEEIIRLLVVLTKKQKNTPKE